MYGTAHRRLPADRMAVDPGLPDPHAACRQHLKTQPAVVDVDRGHARARAGAESAFGNRATSPCAGTFPWPNDQVFDVRVRGTYRLRSRFSQPWMVSGENANGAEPAGLQRRQFMPSEEPISTVGVGWIFGHVYLRAVGKLNKTTVRPPAADLPFAAFCSPRGVHGIRCSRPTEPIRDHR